MQNSSTNSSNQNHISLENLGSQIWNAARNEILLEMPYLASALDALNFVMDLSTGGFGTDAVSIRYNPNACLQIYAGQPLDLNRAYLHMLLHCLFRHMFKEPPMVNAALGTSAPIQLYDSAVEQGRLTMEERDTLQEEIRRDLWNLSCDIAVESLLDQMDAYCISRVTSDFREACYDKLYDNVHTLSAERIYDWLLHDGFPDAEIYDRLKREFISDDHSFWERLRNQQPQENQPSAPSTSSDAPDEPPEESEQQKQDANLADMASVQMNNDEWKKRARRIEDELESRGSEAGEDTGSLHWMLHVETARKRDYRDYLKHFRILREESHVDPDSFDYAYYAYGMEHYGNIPLIEENEYRESNGIEELVIAIDTSASCQKRLVQKFLNETAAILFQKGTFLSRVSIHILECDDQMQKDLVIYDPEEMQQYADAFEMKGGYGTDYRPVFAYVEELRRTHALKHLKGLMYFTDGYGEYPTKPTDYETVFVLPNAPGGAEDVDDSHVPDWAVTLYIDEKGTP